MKLNLLIVMMAALFSACHKEPQEQPAPEKMITSNIEFHLFGKRL